MSATATAVTAIPLDNALDTVPLLLETVSQVSAFLCGDPSTMSPDQLQEAHVAVKSLEQFSRDLRLTIEDWIGNPR